MTSVVPQMSKKSCGLQPLRENPSGVKPLFCNSLRWTFPVYAIPGTGDERLSLSIDEPNGILAAFPVFARPEGWLALVFSYAGAAQAVPELPNPFSARAESSSDSTVSIVPVSTGTGIIWAIFSPARNSSALSPRLVIRMRISPR